MALNIEEWLFISYFLLMTITMIISVTYVKKEYRYILISVIISSILIAFNLIIYEPIFNFIILCLIIANLLIFVILIRPYFLTKKEKKSFFTFDDEPTVDLKIKKIARELMDEGD